MGVERKMLLVPTTGALIACSFFHEMAEQACRVFVVHALWMPLHADDALEGGALHGFDGAIASKTHRAKLCTSC